MSTPLTWPRGTLTFNFDPLIISKLKGEGGLDDVSLESSLPGATQIPVLGHLPGTCNI